MFDTDDQLAFKILHVEDNAMDAEIVRDTLAESGIVCRIHVVRTRTEFETEIATGKYDLILSDLSLPSFDGREALTITKACVPEVPFVFVSGTLGEDAAIECVLQGATDYVLKSKMARLAPAVRRAITESKAKEELKLSEMRRESALENLKQSEARFRGLLDCAPDSAIIVDSDGLITFANVHTENMFGYSKDELIGQPLETLIPDRFKGMHRGHMGSYRIAPHARALNSGLELVAKRKDGSEFPADIMLSPMQVDHEISVLAMIRDITISRQTELALRESEEMFRGIFESSPVAVTNVTPDGRILKANLAATKLLGYEADELQHRHFNDFTHPDDTGIGMKMMADLQSGKCEIVQFEKRYLRKDGRIIRVHLTISAIRGEDRSLRYAITIAQDITERWHAEESLRRSEERYRKLVEGARDAIYAVSSEGRILSVNPAFGTITGWRPDEWIGKSFTDLLHPDDLPSAAKLFQSAINGELSDFETFRIRSKSGSYIVVEASTTRFTMEDGSTGILGIARDVTSQVALEEQLRQAQKMESIGTLAGGIAHDFNNLLGIIIGYATLTLRSAKEDKILERNVHSIESAAERGVGLVRQLLMFARKQERVLQTLDVTSIVNDVYKMVKETFPKVISMKMSAADGELLVNCDQTEIHQAVLNLCVNARDAMMDRPAGVLAGGTLTISSRLEKGSDVQQRHPMAQADTYALISVSDTGVGFGEDTKQRIFEPFFTTKERGKGTGLGLSTVYGIVSSYEGIIEVESEPGKGSTFTLLLPARARADHQSDPAFARSDAAPGGNESILVVEDEPGLRELLSDILRSHGYKVLTADDGEAALALFLDDRSVQLVVSDIGLPKVGGLDLFVEMRKLNPKVKVILVSGFVGDADRQKMLEIGVDRFIQKPYSPNDVLRKIREVLDKSANGDR